MKSQLLKDKETDPQEQFSFFRNCLAKERAKKLEMKVITDTEAKEWPLSEKQRRAKTPFFGFRDGNALVIRQSQ